MANWFKDYQRVLVYLPGAGGEYITALYNGQDMSRDQSLDNTTTDSRNRYKSHNSFPGHHLLFNKARSLPAIPGEWTDECRLHFTSESEIKKWINKVDPDQDWKENTGDPDSSILVREFPIGEYETGNTVIVEKPIWFPTHHDYGVFREPVWKWLDFDDDYWMFHWSFCIFFKGDMIGDKDQSPFYFSEISSEFNSISPHLTWHRERWIFKNYYSQKFPNSRISVDDSTFQKETNYIGWAEQNLEAIRKHLVDTKTIDNIDKKCWDYLCNAMPK